MGQTQPFRAGVAEDQHNFWPLFLIAYPGYTIQSAKRELTLPELNELLAAAADYPPLPMVVSHLLGLQSYQKSDEKSKINKGMGLDKALALEHLINQG